MLWSSKACGPVLILTMALLSILASSFIVVAGAQDDDTVEETTTTTTTTTTATDEDYQSTDTITEETPGPSEAPTTTELIPLTRPMVSASIDQDLISPPTQSNTGGVDRIITQPSLDFNKSNHSLPNVFINVDDERAPFRIKFAGYNVTRALDQDRWSFNRIKWSTLPVYMSHYLSRTDLAKTIEIVIKHMNRRFNKIEPAGSARSGSPETFALWLSIIVALVVLIIIIPTLIYILVYIRRHINTVNIEDGRLVDGQLKIQGDDDRLDDMASDKTTQSDNNISLNFNANNNLKNTTQPIKNLAPLAKKISASASLKASPSSRILQAKRPGMASLSRAFGTTAKTITEFKTDQEKSHSSSRSSRRKGLHRKTK